MNRILAIAILAAGIAPAFAADPPAPEPQCRQALADTKRDAADSNISPQKQAQIQALLEQVDHACQENDDVVAMAGIDQVRAIVETEQKSRNGS